MAGVLQMDREVLDDFLNYIIRQPLDTDADVRGLFCSFLESIDAWFVLAAMARRGMMYLQGASYVSSKPAFAQVIANHVPWPTEEGVRQWQPKHILALERAGYDPDALDEDGMSALHHLTTHACTYLDSPSLLRHIISFAIVLLFHTGFSRVDLRHPFTGRSCLQMLSRAWLHSRECCHDLMPFIDVLLEAGASPYLPEHRYPRAKSVLQVASDYDTVRGRTLRMTIGHSSSVAHRRARFVLGALLATEWGQKTMNRSRHPMLRGLSRLPSDVRRKIVALFRPGSACRFPPVSKKRTLPADSASRKTKRPRSRRQELLL